MTDERSLEELVRWEVADGIGRLTIDRPEARNALTGDMRDRVGDLMHEASADLNVRAVVVTGTGKGFCTGADLRGAKKAPDRPEGAPERAQGEVARMIERGWQRLVASILDCEKPVIAAVNGIAAGGGLHLALACDLVIAREDARLISVFVRRGIAPDAGGAYMLARLIGPQRAKELMFFGDDVSGADAERMGLVNRAVPEAEFDKTVEEWAQRLASGPTKAIAITKRLVNHALDVDRETAFKEEAWGQELVTTTEDMKEGVRAFVERRDPDFKGW